MSTFTIGETKVRPGEYHRTENASGISTAAAVNGIVAGVIRANWGPLNKVVEIKRGDNVNDIFGSGGTTDIIAEAFKEDITTMFVVRAGSGGTAASITLKDTTAEEAVNVITVTSKFVGARAFTATIRDSLTNTDNRECIVYDGTIEFEKFTFAKGTASGEVEELVKAINKSNNFTATKLAAGNGVLASGTQMSFTAGTDPTVNTEAIGTALTALEPFTFNTLCVDSTDTAVQALVEAFVARIYAAGSYPIAVLADASNVDFSARIERAKSINDLKVVYVLNSATSTEGTVKERYIVTARVAAMIAAVPSSQSITHRVVDDFVELETALTNTQIEKALLNGCLVFTTNSDGNVWVEQGINTLVNPSDDLDEGWKKIRRVKTRFELMQRIGDTVAKLVGKINNNADGRGSVVAAANDVINTMVAEGKLSGGSFAEDTANPPKGDSAWFVISVDDLDSIEKFYLTYRFRFSAES